MYKIDNNPIKTNLEYAPGKGFVITPLPTVTDFLAEAKAEVEDCRSKYSGQLIEESVIYLVASLKALQAHAKIGGGRV